MPFLIPERLVNAFPNRNILRPSDMLLPRFRLVGATFFVSFEKRFGGGQTQLFFGEEFAAPASL